MTIQEIKSIVESDYNVVLSDKSRVKRMVEARRVFCYICVSLYKHQFTKTGEAIGRAHDIAIYHNDIGILLAEQQNKHFMDAIWRVVNIDITLDKRNVLLNNKIDFFRNTLLSIPKGKEEEVKERIELMIKGFNFTHKDSCTIYEGEENLKEYAF